MIFLHLLCLCDQIIQHPPQIRSGLRHYDGARDHGTSQTVSYGLRDQRSLCLQCIDRRVQLCVADLQLMQILEHAVLAQTLGNWLIFQQNLDLVV
jgi:hypothetical protein